MFMKLLSMLGYCVGLTQDVRVELSDVFETEAVVSKKECVPANFWHSFAIHAPFMSAVPDEPERHYLVFEGSGVLLSFNNASLYAMLEEGEKVTLRYRRLMRYIHDYIPPNFNSKKLLGSETQEIFDSVEKRC